MTIDKHAQYTSSCKYTANGVVRTMAPVQLRKPSDGLSNTLMMIGGIAAIAIVLFAVFVH